MCEITAHSGCDGTPDNSMEFVRYALASEGNCLEADIRRNRDGELILSHDETAEEAVSRVQIRINGSQDAVFRDKIPLNTVFERNFEYMEGGEKN